MAMFSEAPDMFSALENSMAPWPGLQDEHLLRHYQCPKLPEVARGTGAATAIGKSEAGKANRFRFPELSRQEPVFYQLATCCRSATHDSPTPPPPTRPIIHGVRLPDLVGTYAHILKVQLCSVSFMFDSRGLTASQVG